jgi:hypothetical protein
MTGQWRSNLYLSGGAISGEQDEIPGMSLLVGPELELELDGHDLRIDLAGSYTARQFFTKQLQNLNEYSQSSLNGRFDLFPNSIIGMKLIEEFSVTNRPTEHYWTDDTALVRTTSNALAGALTIQPGSAFHLDAGGSFSWDDYKVPQGVSPGGEDLNTRVGYGPKAELKWTFFPRTALIANYESSWFFWSTNWLNAAGGNNIQADVVGDRVAIPDGSTWRANGGLRGRITERLLVNLMAGYGRSNYDENSVIEEAAALGVSADNPEVDPAQNGYATDLDTFPQSMLVRVELEWSPRVGHTFAVGYWKDATDSWFTNYIHYNMGFFRYDGMLSSRLLFSLNARYRLEDYVGEISRTDQFIRTDGSMTYRASDWLDVSVRGYWMRRVSPEASWAEYDDFGVSTELALRY